MAGLLWYDCRSYLLLHPAFSVEQRRILEILRPPSIQSAHLLMSEAITGDVHVDTIKTEGHRPVRPPQVRHQAYSLTHDPTYGPPQNPHGLADYNKLLTISHTTPSALLTIADVQPNLRQNPGPSQPPTGDTFYSPRTIPLTTPPQLSFTALRSYPRTTQP